MNETSQSQPKDEDIDFINPLLSGEKWRFKGGLDKGYIKDQLHLGKRPTVGKVYTLDVKEGSRETIDR